MFKKGKRLLALGLSAVMAFSLCACGGGSSKKDSSTASGDVVNLKWYIQRQEPAGFAKVMAKVNEYLEEKMGAHLDLVCIQPGDYAQKTQMILASQEEFDLMWQNAAYYHPNVTKGAFVELDELLDSTPELQALFSDGTWEATRIDGKIYGVPMLQVLYDQPGLWFIKDVVDKYSLPVQDAKSLDDLGAIFQTVKDNEPDLIPTRNALSATFQPYMTKVANFYLDANGKVVDRTEETIPGYKTMQEWYKKGFFPVDVTTLADEASLIAAKKIFSRYSRQLPGVSAKFKLSNGYDVVNAPTGEATISRDSVQSTITSISATSKHPEKALQLLELMHTDEYLANLMFYGIEGENWEKDPNNEKRIIRDANDANAYYMPEYLVGNQFLAYLQPSYEDGVWEQTIKENEEAKVDPYNGFAFDRTPVETELTNLTAVTTEFADVLTYSDVPVEETIEKMEAKKEQAGVQKVMDEIQSQFDAWKAEQ